MVIEDIEPGTNEAYVNGKIAGVLAKNFMSIDPTTGNFMIPVSKVSSVQYYMRLTITSVDGVWCPDLDQKFYIKNDDDTFSEVSNG